MFEDFKIFFRRIFFLFTYVKHYFLTQHRFTNLWHSRFIFILYTDEGSILKMLNLKVNSIDSCKVSDSFAPFTYFAIGLFF